MGERCLGVIEVYKRYPACQVWYGGISQEECMGVRELYERRHASQKLCMGIVMKMCGYAEEMPHEVGKAHGQFRKDAWRSTRGAACVREGMRGWHRPGRLHSCSFLFSLFFSSFFLPSLSRRQSK